MFPGFFKGRNEKKKKNGKKKYRVIILYDSIVVHIIFKRSPRHRPGPGAGTKSKKK